VAHLDQPAGPVQPFDRWRSLKARRSFSSTSKRGEQRIARQQLQGVRDEELLMLLLVL